MGIVCINSDLVIKKMKFDLKADALGYLFLLVFVM